MEPSPQVEEMQARHRKEQRELQARITNKKKNATKKTRKGINDECAQLELELKNRQAEELASLTRDPNQAAEQEEPPEEETHLNGAGEDTPPDSVPEAADGRTAAGKKRNRQKDRLARRAAERDAAAATAADEAADMVDHRAAEQASLGAAFKALALAEREVAPDGHCLFNAVADQLGELGIPLGEKGGEQEEAFRTVRRAAAEYMRGHEEDFAPFMDGDGEEGGDFGEYVRRIRDTAEWGGQLELMAVARRYGVEVRVVQEGRTEVISPGEGGRGEGEAKTVWLAYYRHGYGLGEHYNSLRKKAP